MNILLLPCHSILEYDEYKLFTELGHDVFSIGSYINPHHPHDPKRPPILEGKVHERMLRLAETATKDNLHDEWCTWADVVVVHHIGRWVIENWHKIRNKRVIWRTIGQSLAGNEEELKNMRLQGMKIVRYSPMEQNIPGFIGQDAVIRFYKDPDEFKGWVGSDKKVITFMQDVPNRRTFLNFDAFKTATEGVSRKLFGPDNQSVGEVPVGGSLKYDEMKLELKKSRVFFYGGTQPASYTLSFIEALMTGIPVISVGPNLGNSIFKLDLFEINHIIKNGQHGFVLDDPKELAFYINELIKDDNLAFQISQEGRQRAIDTFGKNLIKSQWDSFLKSL
ncbi:MAG: hypothetical protein M1445_12485 [Bacteroidetes bacterium]|nr:hypothetical protein [Bacteroidota bacterium]